MALELSDRSHPELRVLGVTRNSGKAGSRKPEVQSDSGNAESLDPGVQGDSVNTEFLVIPGMRSPDYA